MNTINEKQYKYKIYIASRLLYSIFTVLQHKISPFLFLENNKNLIIIPDETNIKRPNTDPYIV